VYDMYPWDEGSVSAGTAEPAPAQADTDAVNAVQIALDRRDNGGDAAAGPGTPTLSRARQ
jgi:hypothetical protein